MTDITEEVLKLGQEIKELEIKWGKEEDEFIRLQYVITILTKNLEIHGLFNGKQKQLIDHLVSVTNAQEYRLKKIESENSHLINTLQGLGKTLCPEIHENRSSFKIIGE